MEKQRPGKYAGIMGSKMLRFGNSCLGNSRATKRIATWMYDLKIHKRKYQKQKRQAYEGSSQVSLNNGFSDLSAEVACSEAADILRAMGEQ